MNGDWQDLFKVAHILDTCQLFSQ